MGDGRDRPVFMVVVVVLARDYSQLKWGQDCVYGSMFIIWNI